MPVHERQLTHSSTNHNLDNNINFSPDGRYVVFDCRGNGGIGTNTRLGKVDVQTGEETLFYVQKGASIGVGASSFINNHEVIAIHALETGLKYDPTVRGGMIIAADGSRKHRWLDSRNVLPPFTPGALRGGTHKHEPDGSGQWIGFTYNDTIMKAQGSDLRNVGVSHLGQRVGVPANPANFSGESFSVLLTSCVEKPRPGSDEYQKAEGDCWVGQNGYASGNDKQQRARAFRGVVTVDEAGKTAYYSEVFMVTVPDDITKPGPLGPLEGKQTDYPKPQAGATVHRLTFTANNTDHGTRGVAGHLRASGDGNWIAFIGKVVQAGEVVSQVFVVSPLTREVRQLSSVPGGVTGDPQFSANGKYVACSLPDGSIAAFSAESSTYGRMTRCSPPSVHPPSNIVISPDSKMIVYNRVIQNILQVFATQAPR